MRPSGGAAFPLVRPLSVEGPFLAGSSARHIYGAVCHAGRLGWTGPARLPSHWARPRAERKRRETTTERLFFFVFFLCAAQLICDVSRLRQILHPARVSAACEIEYPAGEWTFQFGRRWRWGALRLRGWGGVACKGQSCTLRRALGSAFSGARLSCARTPTRPTVSAFPFRPGRARQCRPPPVPFHAVPSDEMV